MLLIVIQIIQTIYSIYIMFLNKKKNMLINTFISNIISLVLFQITGLGAASLTTILITFRSFLFTFREKYKTNIMFFLCLALHILAGIITFTGFSSLMPCITAIIAVVVFWFGNEQQIRIGTTISNLIWVIYYAINGIYISAITNIIIILFTIVSIWDGSNWTKYPQRDKCLK